MSPEDVVGIVDARLLALLQSSERGLTCLSDPGEALGPTREVVVTFSGARELTELVGLRYTPARFYESAGYVPRWTYDLAQLCARSFRWSYVTWRAVHWARAFKEGAQTEGFVEAFASLLALTPETRQAVRFMHAMFPYVEPTDES